MSECKHGLKWENCPFDNIGCETCESNEIAARSAQGYYNESYQVCESSAQRLFCAQEAYKHLLNQLYATENKFRKSHQQLQAAEQRAEKAEADCASMRAELEEVKEYCKPLLKQFNQTPFEDICIITDKALSTSSGKDMLTLVDAVGEVNREMVNPDNCNTPGPESRLWRAINKAIEALVKVKGHKNEKYHKGAVINTRSYDHALSDEEYAEAVKDMEQAHKNEWPEGY